MPLFINHDTVTVIRDGARVKVKPTGAPFEFTSDEVEQIRAAGGRMDVPSAPQAATVVVSPAKTDAATAKASKAKAKAKAAEDDEDEDGI